MVSALSRVAAFVAASTVLTFASSPAQSPSTVTGSLSYRIIVVDSNDEAQQLRERLLKGEDFATLARSLSIDSSAARGGLLGPLVTSGLRPEIQNAIADLTPGQISPVMRVPTGFAVVKAFRDVGGEGDPSFVSAGLAATGSVRYVFDVSGYSEAILALKQFPKPAGWDERPLTICEMRTQSFLTAKASLERFLASSESGPSSVRTFDLAQAYFLLGQLNAYEGTMQAAIDAFQKAHDVAVADEPSIRLGLEEALGIAYLHKAELDNGLTHTPGERCLLGGRSHRPLAKTQDVSKAIEHFMRYLGEKPDDLEVRWLLNVAHMVLGTYPREVPYPQLIPPSAFDSTEDVGRFVDVAAEAGLVSVASAGGVIVDDFDNDGRLDVVTSDFNSCQPMRFFRRGGNGRFIEGAARAGLGDQTGGLNTLQADYDNDGHLDILLLRGAWEVPQRKSLLRNNGDGTFTDVTVASRLATPVTRTQAAVWSDVNRDGFLDLFVGNEDSPAQLFLNSRDGTFEEVGARAGINRTAFSKGVSASDYDNDGWPDLYVSNLGGPGFLYHNDRNGTFTEVAAAAGVPGSGQGFATWFFDYDNDGWQDLFATSYYTSIDETVRTYLRLPHNATTMKLYRNRGNGTFEDVTARVGLDKVVMPMGANFGDIDNDGFLDIYLGTGNPSYASLVPSVLLRNRNGASFADVTAASGTGELHKGHGVAFADLDDDGDEEIVFQVGGATPGDSHALRLFDNPGNGNDWITLKLTGVKTNRAAIGARIAVTVENGSRGRRVIHRTVTSGGSFGASPLAQHIGLGSSARIVEVVISWPDSASQQRFVNVAKNQRLEISEFSTSYTRASRRSRQRANLER
ncbi:MAG TPA: FG-GAP-like repeat-containing protein [Vicinamibacterales bacterium]|nr:FG-GAP-like repeat-containing protein [Vicinamibacterales bacterium]